MFKLKKYESFENLFVYHGTTFNNYKKIPDKLVLNFTNLYDDAVMYALMGGESRFLSEIKSKLGDDGYLDNLFNDYDDLENQKKILEYLFPYNDYPVILKLKQYQDSYEEDYEVYKSELSIIKVDFDRIYKIEPIWSTFDNYFNNGF